MTPPATRPPLGVGWSVRWSEPASSELVALAVGAVERLLDVTSFEGDPPAVRFGSGLRGDVATLALAEASSDRISSTWSEVSAMGRDATSVEVATRPLRLLLGLTEARSAGDRVGTHFSGDLYHQPEDLPDAACDAVVDVVASVAGVGSPVQAFVGVEQARLAMMNAGLAHLPSEEARTFGYMWLVGLRPVEMEALGGVEAFSEVYPGSVVETGGLGMPWLARMGPTPWVSQEVLEEARVALAPCLVRTERSVRGAMHRAREVYDDSRQGRWLAEADRRLVREWAAAGD